MLLVAFGSVAARMATDPDFLFYAVIAGVAYALLESPFVRKLDDGDFIRALIAAAVANIISTWGSLLLEEELYASSFFGRRGYIDLPGMIIQFLSIVLLDTVLLWAILRRHPLKTLAYATAANLFTYIAAILVDSYLWNGLGINFR